MGDEEEVLVNPLTTLEVDEIQTPNPTDKDNSDINDQDQEDTGKKTDKAPSKEESKKKVVSPEKEKRQLQQEDGKLAEIQRLRNLVIEREVQDASKDITSLLDLVPKDIKLAREVASRFDWTTTTRGNFENFIASKGATSEKPTEWSEEAKEEWYRGRRQQEEHTEALNEAQAKLDELPDGIRQIAIDEFNDLSEGKLLTRAKASKLVNLVTLSLQKEEPQKVDTTTQLKKLSSTTVSPSKKPVDDEQGSIILDGEIVLLDPKNLS